jgi:radical SAM superfamily enzyme YgiQ (UPF0313 family)
MKVLLISANTETINMLTLPLGLACVAAATERAGHEVLFLDLMFEGGAQSAIRHAIEEFRPDAIGLTVRNIDDQSMQDGRFLLAPLKAVVTECRDACDAPIVLGGAGYSIFPESCLRYLGADLGVQGEGEAVFPVVLDRLARGASLSDIPGVFLPGRAPFARSFVSDLDSLPLPEAGLWIPSGPDRGDLWIPVQTRRGCPLDCSYCSTAMIEGRAVRRRSPERVTDWITGFSRAGYRNFNFVDNTFNIPQTYAEELCRGIIQAAIDIHWWCIIYPKWVDEQLVELMAKAGCQQVSLGFESGSNEVLKCLNKQFHPEEVRAISELFRNAGIERRGFLLLGGPGETEHTVEESLAFAESLGLDYLKISVGIRIYPGTQLAESAVAEHLIEAGDDLLSPRYFVTPELRDWLPARVAAYRATHPWVL